MNSSAAQSWGGRMAPQASTAPLASSTATPRPRTLCGPLSGRSTSLRETLSDAAEKFSACVCRADSAPIGQSAEALALLQPAATPPWIPFSPHARA
jgi:hypothetical protein